VSAPTVPTARIAAGTSAGATAGPTAGITAGDAGPVEAIPGPLITAFEVDLDLDQDRRPSPPRRRRPFRILLAVVALLGLVAGAALRSSVVSPARTVEAHVFATLDLRSVVLAPQPRALLELTLKNVGDESLIADTATVAGGGVVTTGVLIGQNLAPRGQGVTASVVVPLRCGPGARAADPVTTRIELRVAASGPPTPGSVVSAVPQGRVSEAGGLCAAAEAELPQGWREVAHAAAWSLTGGRLDLTVDSLPHDATALVGVQADGVLLPWPDSPPPILAGSVHLVLDPPQQGCQDTGAREVVPTGLQLLFEGQDGMRFSYVPVGAAVAGWLMDAYTRTCPSRPAGPSAVRPGFDI